jgi:hypothetical protein
MPSRDYIEATSLEDERNLAVALRELCQSDSSRVRAYRS